MAMKLHLGNIKDSVMICVNVSFFHMNPFVNLIVGGQKHGVHR